MEEVLQEQNYKCRGPGKSCHRTEVRHPHAEERKGTLGSVYAMSAKMIREKILSLKLPWIPLVEG